MSAYVGEVIVQEIGQKTSDRSNSRLRVIMKIRACQDLPSTVQLVSSLCVWATWFVGC